MPRRNRIFTVSEKLGDFSGSRRKNKGENSTAVGTAVGLSLDTSTEKNDQKMLLKEEDWKHPRGRLEESRKPRIYRYIQCYIDRAIYTMLYIQCYIYSAIYTVLYTQSYIYRAIYTVLYGKLIN